MDLGTIALLTTAFTAIAGIVTAILAKLAGIFVLGIYAIPAFIGVFLGIILLISGPSMVLAYIKLRKRNLAPILDANGWAVNAKAVINVPLGQSLTQIAELPPGSQRDLIDPFAAKKFPLALTVFILIVAGLLALGVGWYLGKLDPVLPGKIKSITVLGTNAPAYAPPTNATPVVTILNTNAAPPPPAK